MSTLEEQLSRAQRAYDNRMPDNDDDPAYREFERITDDPAELEDALVEDGVARGLAVVLALRYAKADPMLRGEINAAVEAVVKKRGWEATPVQTPIRELIDWIKSVSERVLALEKAAIRNEAPK